MVVVHGDRSISRSVCNLKARAAATRNATFRQVLIEEAYPPAAEAEVFHAFQFKLAGQLICVKTCERFPHCRTKISHIPALHEKKMTDDLLDVVCVT